MAIQTRRITGPIATPDHEAVQTGFLRIRLLSPISDGETLVAPFRMEYRITDGELPDNCKVSTPGSYELQVLDFTEERVWSFQVDILPDSGEDISVAELWQISQLLSGLPCDPENFDASLFGSDGADAGMVLTADGSGGTSWELVTGEGLGDMLKAVYDTDDDGVVEQSDLADVASLADDSLLFGGLSPDSYQAVLSPGDPGALLVWDALLETYVPHSSVLLTPSGDLNLSSLSVSGPIFTQTFVMNQVYYLVEDESIVLVTIEDEAEVRMPAPATNEGRVIQVKKGSSDGIIVTISSAGGATIEGQMTYTLTYQYEAVTLIAINGSWFIF